MQKICAVSGHRDVKSSFDVQVLNDTLKELIKDGYSLFLAGMARGFDILCCESLIGLRKEFPHIKIKACIPCLGQEKYFSTSEKKRYYNCIGHCDESVVLFEKYTAGCMQARNRYMVDNSAALLAYMYKSSGGTYYTVSYAKEKNKKIVFI